MVKFVSQVPYILRSDSALLTYFMQLISIVIPPRLL